MAPGIVCAAVILFLVPAPPPAHADSAFLQGIHWYSSDPASADVEQLTGTRGTWVVDQALLNSTATLAAGNPWETPWQVSPSIDYTAPAYKAQYTAAVAGKKHTPILRLQPFWGANVPHPSDPYTTTRFAADCKAAANLMKFVHLWQIGNEVNLNGEMNHWNPATQRYDTPWSATDLTAAPELYAATYIACRDKIHEITPDAGGQIVLMQPPSPGAAAPGARYLSSDDFLFRMIAAVPDKSKIDGFALHAYAAPGGSNAGADGFLDDIRRQIAIIDQCGLGDKPIFITEFNKHMPNAAEANIGAQFINNAIPRMHQWNTGTSQLWPSGGNHNIRGAAWFVYRKESGDVTAGWNAYSLDYWKTALPSTSTAENPWYAYQAMYAANYPAGATGGGSMIAPGDSLFEDDFTTSIVDTTWPLPFWEIDGDPSTVSSDGKNLRLQSTALFALAGIRNTKLAFANYRLETTFFIPNASPVGAGECNIEIRVNQAGPNGPGYSLTFFPGTSTVTPNTVALRSTGNWSVYKSAAIAGGISANDGFLVEITSHDSSLEVHVMRNFPREDVLDWTGPNAVSVSDYPSGGVGLYTYNLRSASVNYLLMRTLGAPDTGVADWAIY